MDLGRLRAQDLMKPGHLGRNVVEHGYIRRMAQPTQFPPADPKDHVASTRANLYPSTASSSLVHCDGEGRRARATRDVRASFGRAAPATVSLRLLGFFLRSSGEGSVGVLLRQSEAGAPFRRRCSRGRARGRATFGCGAPPCSFAPWTTCWYLSRFVQSLLVDCCAMRRPSSCYCRPCQLHCVVYMGNRCCY